MYKVFIDGHAGTTGLRIYDRLAKDDELELLLLSDADRKDTSKRKECLNAADLAILCLPDAAAREAVGMVENEHTKIIDASTAHRISPEWIYGFPELFAQREQSVRTGKRVCVPGCHASGFIALIYPLVEHGWLGKDVLLQCFSVTGYSGGGNKMIAEYMELARDSALNAPRQYATAQNHKHLPEMTQYAGLAHSPIFNPIVADYYSGMVVTVPLHAAQLAKPATPEQLARFYQSYYERKGVIEVLPYNDAETMIAGNCYSGKDGMALSVEGNAERICLVARYDNLGKGASGAAIQCMNLMLGRDQFRGLIL